jgi:transposase
VSTVQRVKTDLRGLQLGRCVFVGDAVMVSKDNIQKLALGGGRYIVNMPMRRGDQVTEEVLGRAGRFREVAENLRIKEVFVGDGERRRRYIVCHNPDEETRQRKHRESVLVELAAELEALSSCDQHAHTQRESELRASRRFGKYLRLTKGGRLENDRAKVTAEARLDGKFVVHSNDDTLTAEDVALGYKQLMRVEQAWRTLKTGLEMRPVYHHAVHRIHAHVAITVLALLLERVAERACGDTWRNVRDDLRQVKLVELIGPNGRLRQVTEPAPAARNRLKSLR